MKNQYFADENDYRKYGILRALTDVGLSVGVCWMLTPNDKRNDGRFVKYVTQPAKWRRHDPQIFDCLGRTLARSGGRNVATARELGFLPGARFYEPTLPDDAAGRQAYFCGLWLSFAGLDLVFFDPDNGFEVKSRPWGRKGSSKYLYWAEVAETWSRGHSLMVYQHFPRQERSAFAARLTDQLRSRTPGAAIHLVRTTRVAFLLAIQPRHAAAAIGAVTAIRQRWVGVLAVT